MSGRFDLATTPFPYVVYVTAFLMIEGVERKFDINWFAHQI